ncbi:ATP-binding cassette domain-containing protein [Sphingomonas sp. DT-51]|uniref:ATP-binding cassette domain-containing protein n=1 Tax=Sphingomonas sp. DT-51 TaxID=3396165 RepID=UPI003F195A30
MASVDIEGLAKRFGASDVLRPTDLHIADGEFVVIVSPSGCGKSTLLRLIAGLEEPSAGRVFIGGRDVTDAAPADRELAMVFQSYALYPHLIQNEDRSFLRPQNRLYTVSNPAYAGQARGHISRY